DASAPCGTGPKSVRRESHPPVHLGTVVPGLLGHGHTSKDGRSRTLWSGFGDRLLTQEHVLTNRSKAQAVFEPAVSSDDRVVGWSRTTGHRFCRSMGSLTPLASDDIQTTRVYGSRASGGTRTHWVRLTRAVLGLSSLAGFG